MKLPDELQAAVEAESAALGGTALSRAADELSRGYRREATAPRLSSAQRVAYAAVRMPATFAAATRALAEVRARRPQARVRRLLDLGAGPGTLAWAAAGLFPELEHVTCLERDAALIALGRKLAAHAHAPALRDAEWVEGDLERLGGASGRHDLVVASYVLGELRPAAAAHVVETALAATAGTLVLIEPGTPAGFARILDARASLLGAGARLVAPCPHERGCPMEGRDWCHFGARVERSADHRRAKGAALGHEDEKFSYLAVAPPDGDSVQPAPARVVRRPLARSGHVILDLCTADGLARAVVGRRAGDAFRRARRTDWGDAWDTVGDATPE